MIFEVHPAASIFPMMDPRSFEELKADIKANGVQQCGLLFDGKILDGRNRYKACQEIGIEMTFEEVEPQDAATFDPIQYVLTHNLYRRHLTESQRAMVAAKVTSMRQGDGGPGRPKVPIGTATIDQAAQQLSVGRRSVARAKSVCSKGSAEIRAAVEQGELAVSTAADFVVAVDDPAEQTRIIASGGSEAVRSVVQSVRVNATAEKARPHVANNSGDNEWYTPAEYIEAATEVLEFIDLDPASSEAANSVVNASTFYTAEHNGLEKAWFGNVWLNPPYANSLVRQFCDKLVEECDAGNVAQAIVLVNNATETKWMQKLLGACSAACFPSGRVRFWKPEKTQAATPLQGQAVIYFGGNPEAFCQRFSAFGIATPMQATCTD
jgi:phage N-6-adenine-methyltransferase